MRIRTSFVALWALLLARGATTSPAAETAGPNVLLIYTDDHRFSGVHALGGEAVQTPNLDQLCADGIRFTRTYLMGSFKGATCVPSRATLLTGRNLFELDQGGSVIPSNQSTIGEAFRSAGYHTHIVGKWHQDKASLARSFDSGSTIMSLGPYLVDHYRMPLWDWDPTGKFKPESAYLLAYDEQGKTIRRPLSPADKRGPTGTERTGPHTSEIFADSAIRFIDEKDESKPFFMYLAFHAPHDPRQAPEKYKTMYPEGRIKLPPSYLPQHPFDNGTLVIRDEELAPWPRTPEIARKHLSDYYAAITHLDAQIGRVVQALRNNGTYDQTLIVMAGDSGLAVGCHGLLGKQNVYDEDGLHVPFIISGGPVREKGREIDALCYIHDIYPTICDLAGIAKPDSVTGRSLQPIVAGNATEIREETYHAYRQFQRAYRKGNFKLIEYVRAPDDFKSGDVIEVGSRVTQLFNFEADPWETTDLSFRPEFHEQVKAMRQEMKRVSTELGDNKTTTGEDRDFWDHY